MTAERTGDTIGSAEYNIGPERWNRPEPTDGHPGTTQGAATVDTTNPTPTQTTEPTALPNPGDLFHFAGKDHLALIVRNVVRHGDGWGEHPFGTDLGARLYYNLVEHPQDQQCGVDLGIDTRDRLCGYELLVTAGEADRHGWDFWRAPAGRWDNTTLRPILVDRHHGMQLDLFAGLMIGGAS